MGHVGREAAYVTCRAVTESLRAYVTYLRMFDAEANATRIHLEPRDCTSCPTGPKAVTKFHRTGEIRLGMRPNILF